MFGILLNELKKSKTIKSLRQLLELNNQQKYNKLIINQFQIDQVQSWLSWNQNCRTFNCCSSSTNFQFPINDDFSHKNQENQDENNQIQLEDEKPISKYQQKQQKRRRQLTIQQQLLLQIKEIGRPELLFRLLHQQGQDLDTKGLTTAFNRVYQMVATQKQKEAVLEKLLELLPKRLSEFDAWGLSLVTSSCSKCEYSIDEDLMMSIQESIATKLQLKKGKKSMFEPRSLSVFLLGLQHQKFNQQQVIDKLVPIFQNNMDTMDDINFVQCLISLKTMHALHIEGIFENTFYSVKQRCLRMEATWLTGALHALIVIEPEKFEFNSGLKEEINEILQRVAQRFVEFSYSTDPYSKFHFENNQIKLAGNLDPLYDNLQNLKKNTLNRGFLNRLNARDIASLLNTYWFVNGSKLCLITSQFADLGFYDEELFNFILAEVYMLPDREAEEKLSLQSQVQLIYGLAKAGYQLQINNDENQFEILQNPSQEILSQTKNGKYQKESYQLQNFRDRENGEEFEDDEDEEIDYEQIIEEIVSSILSDVRIERLQVDYMIQLGWAIIEYKIEGCVDFWEQFNYKISQTELGNIKVENKELLIEIVWGDKLTCDSVSNLQGIVPQIKDELGEI